MRTTQQLFEDSTEWHSFHDVLVEVDGRSRTRDELIEVYESLPETIQNIAREWGLSDTVFRDQAYKEFHTRLARK